MTNILINPHEGGSPEPTKHRRLSFIGLLLTAFSVLLMITVMVRYRPRPHTVDKIVEVIKPANVSDVKVANDTDIENGVFSNVTPNDELFVVAGESGKLEKANELRLNLTRNENFANNFTSKINATDFKLPRAEWVFNLTDYLVQKSKLQDQSKPDNVTNQFSINRNGVNLTFSGIPDPVSDGQIKINDINDGFEEQPPVGLKEDPLRITVETTDNSSLEMSAEYPGTEQMMHIKLKVNVTDTLKEVYDGPPGNTTNQPIETQDHILVNMQIDQRYLGLTPEENKQNEIETHKNSTVNPKAIQLLEEHPDAIILVPQQSYVQPTDGNLVAKTPVGLKVDPDNKDLVKITDENNEAIDINKGKQIINEIEEEEAIDLLEKYPDAIILIPEDGLSQQDGIPTSIPSVPKNDDLETINTIKNGHETKEKQSVQKIINGGNQPMLGVDLLNDNKSVSTDNIIQVIAPKNSSVIIEVTVPDGRNKTDGNWKQSDDSDSADNTVVGISTSKSA